MDILFPKIWENLAWKCAERRLHLVVLGHLCWFGNKMGLAVVGWDYPPWAFQVGFPLSVGICSLEKLEVHPRFGYWEQQEENLWSICSSGFSRGCRRFPTEGKLQLILSDSALVSDLSIFQTFLVFQKLLQGIHGGAEFHQTPGEVGSLPNLLLK